MENGILVRFILRRRFLHCELGHEPLRSFVYLDENPDLPGLAVVVVDFLGCSFDIAKSVGPIQITDGIQMPIEILMTVAPVPVANERSGQHVHAFTNGLVIEEFVPLNFHFDNLVADSLVNLIIDKLVSIRRLSDVVSHASVKKSLRLEICGQVSRAFHQQVLVDSALFINRQDTSQFSTRHLRTAQSNGYLRPAIDRQLRSDGGRRGMIVEFHQDHFGQQTTVFLIPTPYSRNTALRTGFRHRPPAKPQKSSIARGTDDAVGGPLSLSSDADSIKLGALSVIDCEIYGCLLAGWIEAGIRCDACIVETVSSCNCNQAIHRAFHVRFRIFGSQLQLRSDYQLSLVGRFGNSFNRYVTNEKTRLGKQLESHASTCERGIHGDFGVVPGGVKPLDSIAHVGGAQRLPGTQRNYG